jgi:hypothetical protein
MSLLREGLVKKTILALYEARRLLYQVYTNKNIAQLKQFITRKNEERGKTKPTKSVHNGRRKRAYA